MPRKGYDFCGRATAYGVRCTDGLTIAPGAFVDNDGEKVPLMWQHDHNNPGNVIGHAYLENYDDCVYVYGYLNNNRRAQEAREDLAHGDIDGLSIYANKLVKNRNGDVVVHGDIKEVSLVLSGANPGAYIESVIAHGDDEGEAVIIYNGENIDDVIVHDDMMDDDADDDEYVEDDGADDGEYVEDDADYENIPEEDEEMYEDDEVVDENVEDILDNMTDDELLDAARMGIAGEIYDDGDDYVDDYVDEDEEEVIYDDEPVDDEDYEEDEEMAHHAFDEDEEYGVNYLSHADMNDILAEAQNSTSLREVLQAHGIIQMDGGDSLMHADGDTPAGYGITDIDYLFPDARLENHNLNFIGRNKTWVTKFLGAAHHSPMSRIKSIYADITPDEARALGYVKGDQKIDEVISLMKRVTEPKTVYKRQRFDHDDLKDITDFAIIPEIKAEMRAMLNEEIARAGLVGDGRQPSSRYKIDPTKIRPVWTDEDFYAIKARITLPTGASEDVRAKAIIRAAIKARKDYRGSGSPKCFLTDDLLSDALLLTDLNGRDIYDDESKLAKKMRVSEMVTVPVMENLSHSVDGVTYNLGAIILNPQDYGYGADHGGNVDMFDDFDINFNQQIYLIETRCSGALRNPFSAIIIEYTYSSSVNEPQLVISTMANAITKFKALGKPATTGGTGTGSGD